VILKQKIAINSITTSNKYWFVIFIIGFSLNFSFAQIRVVNPCAIDYATLINSQPQFDNMGNALPPPADPTNIYYTSTTFIDENPNSTGGTWNFGDGNSATGKIVNHRYATAGNYIVLFTPSNGSTPITQNVTISYAPKAPVLLSKYSVRDTSLCEDFRLDPYKNQIAPSGVSYSWYPTNATTPTILATTSDIYTVKVIDNATGCSVSGSISLNICGTPNPPLPAVAEYHFGNGIKREANHGNAAFATEYPISEGYLNSGVLNSATAASSVSNPNPYHYQRYMFSTDGSTIVGSQGQVIATNISGVGKKAKQTLIVPKIEADTIASTQYYVFAVNEDGVLSYTLIDNAGRNEGDAAVVRIGNTGLEEKNIQLLTGMNGKLTVSKFYSNGSFRGYYIVVAGNDGNYYTFTVTQFGLQGPLVSPGVGPGLNEIGQLKFSDNGQKLISAISAPAFNQIQVCDFDSTAATISSCNLINLGAGPQKLYGLEFSPDGNYIYYTLNGGPSGESEYRRWDIANGRSMLIQKSAAGIQYGALEAYKVPGYTTDIIMAVNGERYLATLGRPNALIPDLYLSNDSLKTIAVRHDILDFELQGERFIFAKSTLGLNNATELPNNSSPSSDAMQFEPDCVDKAITFQATPKCDVDMMMIQYEWEMGDGSATKNGQKVTHTYDKPGFYKIRLFITYCSKPPVIIDDLLVVIPKAISDLASSYENCFKTKPEFTINTKITNLKELDIIYASQLEYEWTGPNIVGSTVRDSVIVDAATNLNLKINYYNIDPFKRCENEFKTTVTEFCPPVFVVPDVFTPNGDGTNDKLDVIKDEIDVDNFKFRIYNRWGELVYYSEKLIEPEPWDGTFKGKKIEADTFAWTVEYRSRFRPNGPTFKNKGALIVAR
jgi:gliding motility-associated-like protein